MKFPSSIWTVLHEVHQDPTKVKDLIVRRYQAPIYDFIRFQGLNHEDAEDLAQEVFVQICRDEFLKRVDPTKGKFRTLLMAVTKNLLLSFHRKELAERRDRRRQVPLGDLDEAMNAPPDPTFDQLWAKNLVEQALKGLEGDPTVKALRLQMEGRSYQEIADELGKQVTDVTNYIHRAKQRLRTEIERLIADYASPEDLPGEVAHLLKLA